MQLTGKAFSQYDVLCTLSHLLYTLVLTPHLLPRSLPLTPSISFPPAPHLYPSVECFLLCPPPSLDPDHHGKRSLLALSLSPSLLSSSCPPLFLICHQPESSSPSLPLLPFPLYLSPSHLHPHSHRIDHYHRHLLPICLLSPPSPPPSLPQLLSAILIHWFLSWFLSPPFLHLFSSPMPAVFLTILVLTALNHKMGQYPCKPPMLPYLYEVGLPFPSMEPVRHLSLTDIIKGALAASFGRDLFMFTNVMFTPLLLSLMYALFATPPPLLILCHYRLLLILAVPLHLLLPADFLASSHSSPFLSSIPHSHAPPFIIIISSLLMITPLYFFGSLSALFPSPLPLPSFRPLVCIAGN